MFLDDPLVDLWRLTLVTLGLTYSTRQKQIMNIPYPFHMCSATI